MQPGHSRRTGREVLCPALPRGHLRQVSLPSCLPSPFYFSDFARDPQQKRKVPVGKLRENFNKIKILLCGESTYLWEDRLQITGILSTKKESKESSKGLCFLGADGSTIIILITNSLRGGKQVRANPRRPHYANGALSNASPTGRRKGRGSESWEKLGREVCKVDLTPHRCGSRRGEARRRHEAPWQ